MALYLSPLVDVNEIDLSTTIPAVATSVGVTVLRNTWKGYEKKQKLITSVDELINTFGEPTDDSYEDILSATGFLKYGSTLYCTRVMPPSATFAGIHGIPSSGDVFESYPSSAAYVLSDFESKDTDDFGEEDVVFSAGRPDAESTMSIIARDRGTNGNFTKVAIIGRDKFEAIKKLTGTTQATTATSGVSATLYNDIGNADFSFDNDNQFLVFVRSVDQEDINKTLLPYSVKEVMLVSTNPREVDDEGSNLFCENYINSNSSYIRMAVIAAFKDSDMSEKYSVDYVSLGDATDSSDVSDADIIEASLTSLLSVASPNET